MIFILAFALGNSGTFTDIEYGLFGTDCLKTSFQMLFSIINLSNINLGQLEIILALAGIGLQNNLLYQLANFNYLYIGGMSFWTPYIILVSAAIEVSGILAFWQSVLIVNIKLLDYTKSLYCKAILNKSTLLKETHGVNA